MLVVKQLSTSEVAALTSTQVSTEDLLETPSANSFPFNALTYQSIFLKHFGEGSEVWQLGVFDGERLLAVVGLQKIGLTVFFIGMPQVLGKEEVTDYGDLRLVTAVTDALTMTAIWQSVLAWVFAQGITLVQLDYLRADSLSYQVLGEASFFTSLSVECTTTAQEVAPYVWLPETWESYVQALPKKHRSELRRKLKRLDQSNPEYEWDVQSSPEVIAEFLRLHKLSDPSKEHFMSAPMAAFFADLAGAEYENGWEWRFAFLKVAGKRVATVAYFLRDQDAILLYNSGYDPEYAPLGVGFGLQAHHIEHAISQHFKVYDFLRGSEHYKFDLGAVALQLYQLKITPA